MEQNLLAMALADVLSDRDGLTAAYLPEGVALDEARYIARAANDIRPSSPPFAVVVAPEASPGAPGNVVVVTSQDLVKYRIDDRLAIVVGRHPELASITTAFSEGLAQSFPDEDLSGGSSLLEKVADSALRAVIQESGARDPIASVLDEGATILAAVLRQLRALHAAVGDAGAQRWNARWFRHVDAGLSNLADVLRWHLLELPSSDLSLVLSQFAFPSFGLPTPANGRDIAGGSGDRVLEALRDWWDSEEKVDRSLAYLEAEAGAPHPVNEIEWVGLDERVAALDDAVSAWFRTVATSVASITALAQLSERQFLAPAGIPAKDAHPLVIETVDGQALSTDNGESPPFIVAASDNGGVYQTEELRIRIPTAAPAGSAAAASGISIAVSTKGAHWDGAIAQGGDSDQLRVRGRFVLPSKLAGKITVVRARLVIPHGDVLEGLVPPTTDAVMYVVPSETRGLLAVQLDSKKRPGRVAANLVVGDGDGPWIAELGAYSAQHRLIAWASEGSKVVLEGRTVAPCEGRPWLFIADFTPQPVTLVQIDGEELELHAATPSRPHASPLLAAIEKEQPSSDPLDNADTDSVRGKYESASLNLASDPDWRRCHGHVVLSSTDPSSIDSVSIEAGVLVPDGMSSAWKALVAFSVPKELLESEEAEALMSAFDALDPFGFAADEELLQAARWPSRYPRRRLWGENRDKLVGYLTAYSGLIERAKQLDDPTGVFWATYPFSTSVWSLEPGNVRCESVLLSPLHPLRLAWLAAVEATFWESDDARQLAGTVQGHGYPLVGPNPYVSGGMLAVQADGGTDQVFAGWAVLLAASTEGPSALKAPARIGGYPAPGTAASGLNGAAVDAALRTYRRMNPHVSTLTLDLGSDSPAPRVAEVDQAVIAVLDAWSKQSGGRLPGGARVLDSAHRTGSGPRDDLTALVRAHPGMPLSWARYLPIPGKTERCNVRILQDAGVQVKVTATTSVQNGTMGAIPLRRFDASMGLIGYGGATISNPGLEAGIGWEPLTTALRLVEGSPSITSRLIGSLLVDDRADWTVSGESMLTPAAISALLQHDDGARMLWEWRPPIFERNLGSSTIERKPYVSVARVPQSFQQQLRGMLSLARGEDATLAQVADLLTRLGSRGVGLSSLLAMGGTHASGALGFYLAFALVDAAPASGKDRLVLPIDASDAFLRILAPEGAYAGDRQRADLLIIDVTDEDLTFTPVEIKFYGLGTEARNASLPTPESAAFGEPLAQLASTTALLKAIERKAREMPSNGSEEEQALWSNGLGSLVEAAAKLSNKGVNPATWPKRLSSVIMGRSRFRVGKPLVLYFNHGAAFPDGRRYEAFRREHLADDAPLAEFGALVADSATTLLQLDQDDSALAGEWQGLLDWASEATAPAPVPEPGRVLAPEPQPVVRSEPTIHTAPIPEPIPAPDRLRAPEVRPGPAQEAKPGPAPELRPEPGPVSLPTPPAADLEGIRFPVGRLVDSIGTASAEFWPSNTQLNQMNIGVVGDLGTGKTQLLKSLVFQLRQGAKRSQENPLSFLIFDYKRDYQDEQFLDAVGGVVLRPYRIPLNIFALREGFTPHSALQRAAMFADVVTKIYGGVGPVQASNLKKAIFDGYSGVDHVAPTLPEVLEGYLNLSGKPDAVSAILQDFVLADIFSSDKEQLLPFEVLIEDTVLVLALSDLGVDQRGKNALVAFFLNMYYDYMLRSTKWKFTDGDPQLRRLNSFLLVDEATNIMAYEFPVLMQLMLQGREFGFGIILASQFLSHFRTSSVNYGQPLLTWFIHKVPSVSIKELNQLGVKGAVPGVDDRIAMLPVHDALYSSFGYNGTFIHGTPFYQLVPPVADDGPDPSDVEVVG
ncbi:hypothetical protein [Agromyces albus]|uniref:hypothetical protein n=1 Tax=Agromyces albus TaxID=205332 RepID=UPI00277D3FCF|nr:hypothetical protein [Agromyces albus]MDQ0576681.1 DNA phosphorothioation-dependent restriction protein DptH [Agromyces albus]